MTGSGARSLRRRAPRWIGALAAAGAVAGAAGCGASGGDGEISAGAADRLSATASLVEQATREGNCELAHSSTTDLRRQVDELEGEVDGEIFAALSEMVSSIDELLDVECSKTGTTDAEQVPEVPETPVAPTAPTTTTTDEEADEEKDEDEDEDEDSGDGGPPGGPPGEGGGRPEPKPTPPGLDDVPPTGGLDTERRDGRRSNGKQAKGAPKPNKDRG